MKHTLTTSSFNMDVVPYRWFKALRALELWAPRPQQFRRTDAVDHLRSVLKCSAPQALHAYNTCQQKGYVEKAPDPKDR